MKKEQERRFEIWKARQEGLSQSAIAEQLGVAQSTVSAICLWLEDAEVFCQMIEAEQPITQTGDPNIDGLQLQARNLQRAQARCAGGSPEYAKRSEQIGWLLLKAAQLKSVMPDSGQNRSSYEYRAVTGLRPMARVTQMNAATIDPDLLREFGAARRVTRLECSKCGAENWAKIDLDYDAAPLAESPVNYGRDEAEEAEE
jgi:hypothetical protein